MSVPNSIKSRGLMLILSSPSGAGKSSIAKNLLSDASQNIKLSVSVTTRERRKSEIEGTHYFFKTQLEFDQMVIRDELLEHAKVHGNSYGTPRSFVEKTLSSGHDVLFDIDYQGAYQLYDKMANDIVGIFILPPSMKELKSRLQRRAEDSDKTIEKRLHNARDEMLAWERYDYVLVNEDLQATDEKVRAILTAERTARSRFTNLDTFIENLRNESL